MNAETSHLSGAKLTREEVADLLYRYPHVSEEEAKLILGFLRKGRHLDIGILTGDEMLKPQLDRFMTDHKKQLGVGFFEGSAVITAIVGFLAICWLVWETVKPGAV